MPLIGASDIVKRIGDRMLLSGVSLTIEHGEKVGVVGDNGSGKSTFAKILMGVAEADSGEVVVNKGATVSYLSQTPDVDESRTAVDEVLSALGKWQQAKNDYEAVTSKIAADPTDAFIEKQLELASQIETLGGWELDHQAKALLNHVGIPDGDATIGKMSGGEKRRIALARELLRSPDLLVLDEPTNHLDIPTINWLESFLTTRYQGAVLFITHDRHMLNRVADRTVEVDNGGLFVSKGGWEAFLLAKHTRLEHDARVESNRQNFLRRELEWLKRQPKARTTKSKARIDRAHEAMDKPKKSQKRKTELAITSSRLGKTILDIRDLEISVPGKKLVKGLTFSLAKGDRVGIVGANGCGKTTLLRALLGQHQPDAGTVSFGKNTETAYLDQSRDMLNPTDTVSDAVADGGSHITLGDETMQVRTHLIRFGFSVPEQKKKVAVLSGGEKARLAIAKTFGKPANLIVLDEPTNDLDVSTLTALEASLIDSQSCALIVTHDRYFLDRIATHIIAFEPDGTVALHHGNYSDYRERIPEAPINTTSSNAKKKKKKSTSQTKSALTYAERLELESIEEKIEAAEKEVATLQQKTTSSAFSSSPYDTQSKTLASLVEKQAHLDELILRWEFLESKKTQE